MGFFLFLFLILLFITKYFSSKEIPTSSTSASASALSSINIPQRKYDVFLSFRGEDTRNSFTGHLYQALLGNKIETFKDDKLIRGDEIPQSLLNAIEGSTISIIVFSERYASSGWCIDELVKILECKNMYGQIVIPIFYHVDPSHVRNQTGTFGDSFLKIEKRFKGKLEKLQKWRVALKEAANLSGFDSCIIRHEPELKQKVVKDILKKLKDMDPSDYNKDLIGVESRIDEIESLLSHEAMGVYTLGIWGMGGIGKTTIAGALFNKISSQFDGSYFMSNIREESETIGGLTQLRRELFFTLLGDENLNMGFYSFDFHFEIRRLSRKKVLIVFDDVTKFEQINFLIRSFDRFFPGSLIIVTTRDKHILENCGVKIIYEMKMLVDVDALKLFCWHAFRQSHPNASYEKLSNKVMQYAQGVPLVLKVLGCFLYGRSARDWENEINKLESIPPNEVQKVLKISYDGLDDAEQKFFLDIACFFNGEDKDLVEKFLDACGLFPKIGLTVLVDRSLVIITHNKVIMHDLLQEMGREIVRQESVDYPENRSRLWNHEDVHEVFTHNTGTQAIQGIYLNMDRVEEINLNLDIFKQMRNLRFLKFYGMNKFKICDFRSEGYIFHKLRYFCWDGYPLKSLSSNIRTENLVFLELHNSKVEQLCGGSQNLVNLKKIDLSFSRKLTKLPNLSNVQNLEKLILEGCSSLKIFPKISSCNLEKLNLNETAIEELPSSIDCLCRLDSLYLRSCKSLKSLSSNLFNLKSLRFLDLSYCSNLKSLPEISSCNLEKLCLDRTAIEELPSSIQYLNKLVRLSLSGCSNLKNFPETLPYNLKYLYLGGTAIEELPSSIQCLNKLVSLSLSGCSNLKSFLTIASCNLENLYLNGTAIEELPSSIEFLSRLVILALGNCSRLNSLPSSLCKLKSLTHLYITGCSNLQRLPEEIGNLDSLRILEAGRTGITEVPSSIVCLKNLDRLYLERLRGHEQMGFILPPLDGLHSLQYLKLTDCSVTELPKGLFKLYSLNYLYLDKNKFERIPESIINLCKLQWLSLNHCERLQSLPNLPSSLQYIDAKHCSSLESLSGASNFFETCYPLFAFRNYLTVDQNEVKNIANKGLAPAKQKMVSYPLYDFGNCYKLDQNDLKIIVNKGLQIVQHAVTTKQLRRRGPIRYFSRRVRYPGSEIPEFFKFQNIGSTLTLEVPPGVQFNSEPVRFLFGLIVSFGDHQESDQNFLVICEWKVKTKSVNCVWSITGCFKSDHVILGYNKFLLPRFACDFREYCYNNEAIFEFHLLDSDGKRMDCCGMVKKCGNHLFW